MLPDASTSAVSVAPLGFGFGFVKRRRVGTTPHETPNAPASQTHAGAVSSLHSPRPWQSRKHRGGSSSAAAAARISYVIGAEYRADSCWLSVPPPGAPTRLLYTPT